MRLHGIESKILNWWNEARGIKRRAVRRRANRRPFTNQSERLEERALLSVVSDSGGQSNSPQEYQVQLDPGLNIVRFQNENYSIPDEFQIQYQGKRVAGDVGLTSGGRTGKFVVAALSSGDQLNVKVTAPNQGTAWDFTVETAPLVLKVEGKLGDVIKVDLNELFRAASSYNWADVGVTPDSFAINSTSNSRGRVAEIDDWQNKLKTGEFYFVPTVSGTPLNYGESHTNDSGLGDSELIISAMGKDGNIQIPLQFTIIDGISTSGDNAVDGAGTTKLDIYRQEQRLAYLGFPGTGGSPLIVDGNATDASRAMKIFDVATNPAAIRPSVDNSGTSHFKQFINDPNAPHWYFLGNISGLDYYSGRKYGIDTTGKLIADAQTTLGVTINAGGAAYQTGDAAPSTSHDGGRGFDIDNIPDAYLFRTVAFPGVAGGYVRAQGPDGSIVVAENGTYRVGSVQVAADRANGLLATTLANSTTDQLISSLDNQGLLVYTQSSQDVQTVLDAFTAAGATVTIYNDPRFINGTTIKFYRGHFNHMHFGVPSTIGTAAQIQQNVAGTSTANLVPPIFAAGLSLATPIAMDLGRLGAAQNISGSLDATHPGLLYRFEIGNITDLDAEREYFDTLRNLTLTLSNLTDNADLELMSDVNEDGVFDAAEIWSSSANGAVMTEVIDATALSTGVYYVRVVRKGGDTNFDLEFNLAALPVVIDSAGDNVTSAADLGVLAGMLTRNDFIGETDQTDLYKFQLAAISDIDVLLDGLTDADVAVAVGRDANGNGMLDHGEAISVSDAEGNAGELLHLTLIPTGNYLVEVTRVSGNSNYQLKFTASPSVVPADQAGNTAATAFNLGSLAAVINTSDFVGGADPVDWYKFSVAGPTGITIDLTGLSADADVEIYRDVNLDGLLDSAEVLATSRLSGINDEHLQLNGLKQGAYFVRVVQYEGDTTYTLSLRPEVPTGADLVVTRIDVTTPSDLGSEFTYTLRITNNGPDAADNVKLTETLLNGLQLNGVVPSLATASVQNTSNGFEGNIPGLASGESVTFDVTVKSFIAGNLPTATLVTSDSADFDISDNSLRDAKAVSQIVSPAADLELAQTVSNLNPDVGEEITITLSLTNKGPGTATVIKVRDVLPAGLTYISSSANLGSYDVTTGIWSVGNMPPNESVALQLQVNAATGVSLTNTAEVIAVDEADPDSTPNNNQATEDDQTTVDINGIAQSLDFDIDGNGVGNAFQDAVLVFAWMLRDDISDADFQKLIPANADPARDTAAEVKAYLDSKQALLDIDGNGVGNAFQDAVLVYAWMLGNDISDADFEKLIPADADPARNTVAEIRIFLDGLQSAAGAAAPAPPSAVSRASLVQPARQTPTQATLSAIPVADADDDPQVFNVVSDPVLILATDSDDELDSFFAGTEKSPSGIERLLGQASY